MIVGALMDWAEDFNTTMGGEDLVIGQGTNEEVVGGGDEWPPTPPIHSDLHNLTSHHPNETQIMARPEVLGPGYHKQLRQGILGVMFLVALVGNSRVMWSLRSKWGKRGRMTILSFNLTLADTLVVLSTILGKYFTSSSFVFIPGKYFIILVLRLHPG
ncbi:uncharacterized protein LOC121869159 [Homarus americanus]|uniref:uncharacterized protein LOC121869159 n=1 Tax=Homarus americanus TaxID=6706 RepID=UPI001C482AC1|nr:uncharacterized protein LOC121869159 [Homarus americanus]